MRQQDAEDPNKIFTRTYETNRSGKILNQIQDNDGAIKHQSFYYVNGKGVADVGTISTSDFNYNQQAFANQVKNASPSSYIVRKGDTLRDVASAVYGNAGLWYVIAEANSVAGDAELIEGMSLNIPPHINNANNADNFRPYNPGAIIGDTTPIPIAPPPPDAGCNAIATIIIVIVVIIVTIYTAGAAAGGAGQVATTTTAVSAEGAIAATTFDAGLTALAGGYGSGAAVTAGLAGGLAGAAAGQVAGNALGVRDGYSLREIFAGGLTGAATAGVTAGIAGANTAAGGVLTATDKAIVAATGVIAGAAANKVVGLPSGFRWSNVAASAAASYTGSALGLSDSKGPLGFLAKGDPLSQTFGGIVHSALNYSVRKGVFNEGSWNFTDVAANAFGSAIGNSIVQGLSTPRISSEVERFKELETLVEQYKQKENEASLVSVDKNIQGGILAAGEAQKLLEKIANRVAELGVSLAERVDELDEQVVKGPLQFGSRDSTADDIAYVSGVIAGALDQALPAAVILDFAIEFQSAVIGEVLFGGGATQDFTNRWVARTEDALIEGTLGAVNFDAGTTFKSIGELFNVAQTGDRKAQVSLARLGTGLALGVATIGLSGGAGIPRITAVVNSLVKAGSKLNINKLSNWVTDNIPDYRLEWTPPKKRGLFSNVGGGGGSIKLVQKLSIDARIENLRTNELVSGDKKVFDTILKLSKKQDLGAVGLLEAVERHISNGRKVELITEGDNALSIKNQARLTNPDLRVNGELTEIKTTDKAIKSNSISKRLNDANRQIKNSGFDDQAGAVEIQLKGEASKNLDIAEVNRQISNSFRPNQFRSLNKVTIISNGQQVSQYVRLADGTVVKI